MTFALHTLGNDEEGFETPPSLGGFTIPGGDEEKIVEEGEVGHLKKFVEEYQSQISQLLFEFKFLAIKQDQHNSGILIL